MRRSDASTSLAQQHDSTQLSQHILIILDLPEARCFAFRIFKTNLQTSEKSAWRRLAKEAERLHGSLQDLEGLVSLPRGILAQAAS